jgi:DNA-binding protein H-NS
MWVIDFRWWNGIQWMLKMEFLFVFSGSFFSSTTIHRIICRLYSITLSTSANAATRFLKARNVRLGSQKKNWKIDLIRKIKKQKLKKLNLSKKKSNLTEKIRKKPSQTRKNQAKPKKPVISKITEPNWNQSVWTGFGI